MTNSDKDPFVDFVNGLLGFPSAVYQRGSEHGKEWSRIYRGGRDADEPQPVSSCPYLAREGTVAAQSGDGDGDDTDDWIRRVSQELQRNEQRARGLYTAWKREDDEERARLDDEAKKLPNGEEEKRHHWWGSRCDTNKRGSDNKQTISPDAMQRRDEFESTLPAAPTVPPTDFDRIHKELRKRIEGWDKDMDKFIQEADAWRKQWFKDDKFWPGTDLFGTETPFSRPLSSLFALGMAPAFFRFEPDSHPIGYLLYSQYSPLALEHQEGFDKDWRNRFEDLIRAQDGKELMTQEEMASAGKSSGMTWLTQRLLPLLSKEHGHPQIVGADAQRDSEHSQHNGDDDSTEPTTEADMYKVFHGLFTGLPHDRADYPADTDPIHAAPQLPKPDILSTLTTTEQHVGPDGTVRTKTVLKRRFADGREETEEKTETSSGKPAWTPTPKPLPWDPPHHASAEVRQSTQDQRQQQAQIKKGWFWSS